MSSTRITYPITKGRYLSNLEQSYNVLDEVGSSSLELQLTLGGSVFTFDKIIQAAKSRSKAGSYHSVRYVDEDSPLQSMDDDNCSVEIPRVTQSRRDFLAMWKLRGGESLTAKRVYTDERVLLDGWDLKRQADPKDNNPYEPPGGDYFMSTYNRMGSMQDHLGTSETHDMLEQIALKPEYEPRYPRKPLVSFVCYEGTESAVRCKQLEESGISQYPWDYALVDYRSTMQRDYTPTVPRIQEPIRLPEVAFLQNRHCISELNDGMSLTRRGNYKFLDDNKEEFRSAQGLRLGRYMSYDPAKGTFMLGNCPWPPPHQETVAPHKGIES